MATRGDGAERHRPLACLDAVARSFEIASRKKAQQSLPAAITAGSGGDDSGGIHLESVLVMASESLLACIKKAELENAQLRKLVVDLLLQKALLEEKLLEPRSNV